MDSSKLKLLQKEILILYKCCSTVLEIVDQFSYFNRDIVCKFMDMDNSQND